MNIKQKLILAFAAIASVPVILVAVLIILNVRQEARETFIDSNGREIRQVENSM
jgi:methyl-accepting chemotaxis protein